MAQEIDSAHPNYLMYTMDNCPWCVKAKALLEYYGASYKIKHERCEEWDTYPAIYKVNGESMELIGGFNELANYSFQHGL
jgi:glutaredoxin